MRVVFVAIHQNAISQGSAFFWCTAIEFVRSEGPIAHVKKIIGNYTLIR